MLPINVLVLLAVLVFPSWALAGTGYTTIDGGGPGYLGSGDKTADSLIKTGTGMVHTVVCASDAAATAGTLAIRDAVSAGTGTILQQIEFVAAFFPPVTMTLDQEFSTGLYLDFTTTADVHCSASYK